VPHASAAAAESRLADGILRQVADTADVDIWRESAVRQVGLAQEKMIAQ